MRREPEKISYLPEYGLKALKGTLTVKVDFKAYTPWYGGDFKTYTASKVSVGDRPEYYYYVSSYPTAYQLLGRMRWLARAAIGLGSHRESEMKPIVNVKLKLNNKEKSIPIPLLSFMFGATSAQKILNQKQLKSAGIDSWRGIVVLQVEPAPSTPDGQLTIQVDNRNSMFVNEKDGLNNTRFDLLKSSRKRDEESVTPVNPSYADFTARLFIRHGAENLDAKVNGNKLELNYVLDAAATLLVATPLLIGLGKASTRGFGRFVPLHVNPEMGVIRRELPHFAEALETIGLIMDVNSEDEAAKQVKNLALIVKKAFDGLGAGSLKRGVQKEKVVAPVIDDNNKALFTVEAVRAKRKDKGRWWVLSAIGRASLKKTWKTLGRGQSGLPDHTWVLGLPRSQKYRGSRQRRQSMIIAFPLPSRKHDSIETSDIVAVILMGSYDLLDTISRVGPSKGRREKAGVASPSGRPQPQEIAEYDSIIKLALNFFVKSLEG